MALRNELISGNFANALPNSVIGFTVSGTPDYLLVENGLQVVGSAIHLGGTATGPITIGMGAYDFILGGNASMTWSGGSIINLITSGTGFMYLYAGSGGIDIQSLGPIQITENPPSPTTGAGILMRQGLQLKEATIGSGLSIVAGALVSTGGSAHIIQDEGLGLTPRSNLNFVGANVTVTDDVGNDATVVTVSGVGGGISNTAAITEFPRTLNGGGDLEPSGLWSNGIGNIELGDPTLAGNRAISVAGSATSTTLSINGDGSSGHIFLNANGTLAQTSYLYVGDAPAGTTARKLNVTQQATGLQNTVGYLLKLQKTSTVTPTAGIGVGIEFETHTAASYETGATIEAVTTNVGSGTEAYDLVIKTMTGGAAAAERLRISADYIDFSNFTEFKIDGVSSSSPTTEFLRADGSFAVPPGGGGGDVFKVATPANDQVGVWTGDGTIEGDVDLTFNGTILTIGTTMNLQAGWIKMIDSSDTGIAIEGASGSSGSPIGKGAAVRAGDGYGVGNNDGGAVSITPGLGNGTGLHGSVLLGPGDFTAVALNGLQSGLVMQNSGITPSGGIANGVAIYCKDVTASAELFAMNEAGTEFQLTSTSGGSSPLTTKGDLYTYSTVDARLPVGTNGYVLTADSGETTGIKWAPASGGTKTIILAVTDEATVLAAATGVLTFRMPYALTLTGVRASLVTAQTSGSLVTVDINEAGVSVLSTKITIDNTEKTSTTAVTAPVISDSALADDAEITIDIDVVGDGTAKGLKITLIGT